MFKLTPDPTFKAEVEIPRPGASAGRIKFEFSYKDADELSDYMNCLADLGDIDGIMEIVTGWSGVDVPFNRDNLELLVKKYNGAAMRIFKKYTDELTKARSGN